MGLCDMLLLAPASNAARLIESTDPLRDGWSGHRLDQVDGQLLSILGCVVRGDPQPTTGAFDWPRLAELDDEDGQWVHAFPAELADLLRGLTWTHGLAVRWQRAHELLEFCDREVLTTQFTATQSLLEEAERAGSPLLHWSMG